MPRSSANNPFTPDQPITDEERFFGREDVVEWVDDLLVTGERLVLVYGTPRIGKTSLLYRLRSRLASHATAAYVDLTTAEGPAVEILWGLISEVHAQLGKGREEWPALRRDAFVAQPERLHSELLPLWRQALRGRPLALLVDGLALARLNEGPWAELVLWLRDLVAREADVWLVLAVAGASSAPGGLPPAIRGLPGRDLEGLNESEAEELLVGLARFQLGFDYDAIRRIYTLTGGHPYLLHLFGAELFRRLAPMGQVTIHAVGELIAPVISVAEHLFREAWEGLARDEQVTLAAIGSLAAYQGTVTPWDIVVLLRRQSVIRSIGAVERSLQELCKHRILHSLGGSGYALYMDLWRPWLASVHPLVEVLTGKRPRRAGEAPVRRRITIDWAGVLVWGAIVLAVLVVARVWASRSRAPAVVPLPTPAETPLPRPTATRVVLPGKICYMAQSTPHDSWSLWVMSDDGSDPVRLTDGTSDDTLPAWSPDGKRIAYVSNRAGNRDIWIMNADGTHRQNVTRTAADEWTPAWSPDGASIAFASNRDGNWELYVAKADGTSPQRITWSPAADYAPSWSPDGKRIAFVSERDGNPEIYVVNRDGSGLQRLTKNDATDLSPRWSPDGTRIAFETYRDGNMEIYTMAPDGSDLRNLTNDAGCDEHGPAWSPDGKWIAFYSNRDGSWDIFKMRADGSQKTNLTQGPAIEQAPAWQPSP